jgi:hypothetical protein
MPYSQKTTRRIRRHIVTLDQLTRTNIQVTCELERLDFWSEDLDEVVVWLVPVSTCYYGWHSGTPGSISIPSISLAQLGDFFSGRYLRLTDILRHEWAHALADVHPGFVECRAFVRCFGGEYEDPEGPEEYDRELHVSKYAATMPAEDFAETFHFYIRHKGRLPVRLAGRPAIVRKWDYMDRIARAMGSGRTRFR